MGATDETLSILNGYGGNFFWVSESDHGQSDAINKGWLKSSGAILAYLNSDGTYCPDAVATGVNYLVQHPDIAMIYADCYFIDENGSLLKAHKGKQMDFEEV